MADNKYKPLGAMSDEQRTTAIERAELERIRIVEKLEERMREFAKMSGRGRLGRRKTRVGRAPNDWKKKNKL